MSLNDFILKCEEENKQLRKDIVYYKNNEQRLEQENKRYKYVIDKARHFISSKIVKSFVYDYGIDTRNPTQSLFTETVIELEIIDDILKGVEQ